MDDETERHKRISKFADFLASETNDFVDGLFELIERLETGNPRWTKKERKLFSQFVSVAIENDAALLLGVQRFQMLWKQQVEISTVLKQQIVLLEERIQMLKDGRD